MSKRWIATTFDFPGTDWTDCILVTASSEVEAAEIAAERFQERWDEIDGLAGEVIEHVFITPWDGRQVYAVDRRFDAERAEWQCCGGPNGTGGHFGACPVDWRELGA